MSGCESSGLTYAEVGATRGTPPSGYLHVERQRSLGAGRAVFERAATSMMSWEVQRGAGLTVLADSPRVEPGANVTVRLGLGPLAVSAPCRVVYTIEEPHRVGFAYGTLAGHPESGEELFLLEHSADDDVTLTVRAFSRPARWFSRLAAPGARLVQRRVTQRYLHALARD